MFESSFGLVVAFLLLAGVTGWNVIRTKGNYILKAASICILLWYGLAVFFTIPNIMGWSAKIDLPGNAKIIGVRIIEPKDTDKGAIYFWLNEKPQHSKDAMNLLRPDKVFIYTGLIQPRAYKVPYDRELHRKLIEAIKKQKNNKGSSLMTGEKGIKQKGKSGEGRQTYENPTFKVLNPFEMLPKN